jgi:hypothetical protein
MKITRADLRALRDIESKQNRSAAATYTKNRNRAVEPLYPIAAAIAAAKGFLTRYEQSETCKPGRRRYFSTYRLTDAGRSAIAKATGA